MSDKNRIVSAFAGSMVVRKYDSDWSVQIPVWTKFIKAFNELPEQGVQWSQLHSCLCSDYYTAIDDNNPQQGFEVIIKGIEYLNKLS